MKASELRPGQFFEWNGVRHIAAYHDEAYLWYVVRDCTILDAVPLDTLVNPNVPQCWEGEQEPDSLSGVYSELISKRKATDFPMAVGKHTAASASYCKSVIESLQATGHHAAADWAIWMLWWRMMDWQTAKQVDAMRLEEIQRLKEANDHLRDEFLAKPTDQPPQFQPGDWVVCVDDGNCSGVSVGDVLQVVALDGWGHPGFDIPRGRTFYQSSRFRPATPAEIEAANPKLQLREGGWYRQINGHVRGPAVYRGEGFSFPWQVGNDKYHDDGKWQLHKEPSPYDLIEEVPDPRTDSEGQSGQLA